LFAAGFPPAVLTTYFKVGPFAWDGLFPWWIPVIDYTVWSVVMSYMTAKAVAAQFKEEGEYMAVDRAYSQR
jgi:hypothetical protein